MQAVYWGVFLRLQGLERRGRSDGKWATLFLTHGSQTNVFNSRETAPYKSHQFKVRFLSLGTIVVWGWIIFCGAVLCNIRCLAVSGLHPLDASSNPQPSVTTRNVSRLAKGLSGGNFAPGWEALIKIHTGGIQWRMVAIIAKYCLCAAIQLCCQLSGWCRVWHAQWIHWSCTHSHTLSSDGFLVLTQCM